MAEPTTDPIHDPIPEAARPTLAEAAASCLVDGEGAVPVAQVRAAIARVLPRVRAVETVALRSALGRVLARDVVSAIDVPSADNAAMDGYALRGAELPASDEGRFAIAGAAHAGRRFEGTVGMGECVRILTGAVMPAGLDTVVPQELCSVEGGRIVVAAGAVRSGAHRRRAGEDLARGSVALRAGRTLQPADLGLLASLGRGEVAVFRRLRIAFFSSGNELRSVGEALEPGCVYDSNRYTLWAMLQRLGVDVVDLGIVRDEPAALEAAFATAARDADAVITSGGVSVGDADHTRRVMARFGEVLFWHVAMRPGRPMAIGRIASGGHEAMLFGLPGNPVAVIVTFYALVRDALIAMSGASAVPPLGLRAFAAGPIKKRPGRTEYQRGIVAREADGRLVVRSTGAQGSGILRSMSEANAFVVLGHEQGDVAAGGEVEVWPFDGLV